MRKSVWIFLLVVCVGSLGLIGYYFAKPYLDDRAQRNASDAGSAKYRLQIGVDNWIGYFPLCSREMRKRMRGADFALRCVDDKADYPARMQALKKGKLDFAVATVDSFILNAAPEGFPGSIVAVIDESRGGDAIVAQKARIESLEALKKAEDIKIAYTPQSPSEHLIKSVSVHFYIPFLRSKKNWRKETDGSPAALKMLSDAKVEAAVLWEPDVSRALKDKRFVKILGTDDTSKLIVDVLVASRETLLDKPEVVRILLSNYFRVLKYYRENPEQLEKEVVEETGLDADNVKSMLDGVRWFSLTENARQWFGVSSGLSSGQEGLIDTIDSTVDILRGAGDFRDNPLPDRDPYRLQNRSFVKSMYEVGISSGFGASSAAQAEVSLEKAFPALSKSQWDALSEVGTLKIRPITFQSGTAQLQLDGKRELDKAAANLKHYPNFRVVVRGHTALRGDKEANRVLSQERAEAVVRYMQVTYNIDSNRLYAKGYGSSKPLPKKAGESSRSYNYRLPRVELYLVAEEF